MTHCEQFNTTKHAKQFQKLSCNSIYIPTTMHHYTKSCVVRSVENPLYENFTKQKLKIHLFSILQAVKQGILYNIYHLDIKEQHLGSIKNRGVLLDWSDSVYIKENPNSIYVTVPPTNLQEILENPTHTNLLNGIISQLGLLFFKLNIVPSKKVYEHPEYFKLRQLFKILDDY